jgi:anti-anti-sigma factor
MFECSLSEQYGFKILDMKGRIDGMSAPEIEKRFSALILDGERTIVANLQETTYISSAGLRVFLSAQKRLAKAGGEVVLYRVPPMVMDVLEMSNFTSLFRFFTEKDLIDPAIQGSAGTHEVKTRTFGPVSAEIIELQAAPSHLEIIGSQEKFALSEYSEEDVVTVMAKDIRFGAGLATYGEQSGDYMGFFGESVVLNHNLYFYPAVKRPAVDFIMAESDSDSTYRFLHGFGFSGAFRYLVSLESTEGFLDLNGIVQTIFELSSANCIGIALLAESKGFWGMHVRKVPTEGNRPENGLPITAPENFRDWMSYPVEPGDFNHIVAGAGIAVRERTKERPEVQALFPRDGAIHFHGGVFGQEPLNRNVSGFEAEFQRVLTELEVFRVQHILGQSRFNSCLAGIIELESK